MTLNQAVEWLATHKNRHITPATLQKTTIARLTNYGLSRDQGLYYPL